MTELELAQMRDTLEATLEIVRLGIIRAATPYVDPAGPTPADITLALKRMRRAIFDKIDPAS